MAAEPLRVFICDDVPEIRTLLRYGLEQDGAMQVVGEADEPLSGIPLIAASKPDVVIIDLSMPEMGGLDAVAELCATDSNAAIVVYSGLLEGKAGSDAIASGADAYMSKAEPLEHLRDVILKVVADRRAAEADA